MLSPYVGWAVLAGCRLPDAGLGADGESGPRIAVDRPDIAFPTVDLGDGDGGVVQRLTVRDVGTEPLTVFAPQLVVATDFHAVAPSTTTLAPGASFTYDVTFDPRTAFGHDDVLVIESNDPDTPTIDVALHGVGLAPVLEVDPTVLDFGVTYVGCDIARGVVIGNTGNDLLIVQVPSFETTSPELAVDGSGYPLEIGPGDVATVEVVYRPLDERSDRGVVVLASNDPFAPQTLVAVTADAHLAGKEVDSFVQASAPMTDIVLAVDDSESMAFEQAQLAHDVGSFVAWLDTLGVDYRIGVITTGQSTFRGDVLTRATPDVALELAQQVVPGTGGAGTSRGIQMLYECVAGGDCGAGFLRDDALLAAVVVSDGSDRSDLEVGEYVAAIQALKGAPNLVRIHAIAGPVPGPPSCATCESAGHGLDEAQALTGGTFLDICTTDWGASLAILAASSLSDVATFALDRDPVEETIEVAVDGSVWGGWTYTGHLADGGTNAVRFEGGPLPPGGSQVDVSYVIAGDCR